MLAFVRPDTVVSSFHNRTPTLFSSERMGMFSPFGKEQMMSAVIAEKGTSHELHLAPGRIISQPLIQHTDLITQAN